MSTTPLPRTGRTWVSADDCHVDEFAQLVDRTTDPSDYPYGRSVEQNVLVYGHDLGEQLERPEERRAVQDELTRALMDGPGIVVFEQAFAREVVDQATTVFETLIAEQKAQGAAVGDHFAKPGANDRLWGGLEKLATTQPDVFAEYYANDIVALVSTAWLGPGYQINADVNVVNPGGEAQEPHRDYHLGFMSADRAAEYPRHAHRLSPVLTLQGAVAHCDMPVETGPTLYLPYSQHYEPGYLAAGLGEFKDSFAQNYVQLPLRAGDAVFFNPALFHGAGANRSADVRRMANLLQISSAFGRSLGAVDRARMSAAIYPRLRELRQSGTSNRALKNVIAAAAEGYPFPTNLDRDQPVGALVPESQAELVWRALENEWDPETLRRELEAHAWRHRTGAVGNE